MMQKNIKKYQTSKATALITAILIVAVVSITAITMQGYLRSEMNRTQLILENDNLLNSLLDIEAWGLARIKKINSKSDQDDVAGKEFLELNINATEKTQLGKIVELNGVFNLNYLYDENFCSDKKANQNQQLFSKIFANLLKQTIPDLIPNNDLAKVTQDVKSWMCSRDKNVSNEMVTAESEWAYQKARQFYFDTSELILATGINRKAYFKISKYLTAFPVMSTDQKIKISIDIESITPGLFSAMADVSREVAKNFLTSLKGKTSVEKYDNVIKYISDLSIYNADELKELEAIITKNAMKTGSYYMILGTVIKNDNIKQMQTLVHQDKTLEILWRKRGHHHG